MTIGKPTRPVKKKGSVPQPNNVLKFEKSCGIKTVKGKTPGDGRAVNVPTGSGGSGKSSLAGGLLLPLLLLAFFLFLAAGCTSRARVPYKPYQPAKGKELARMGYSIQAGSFSNAGNAAKLTRSLKQDGVDAYYFVHRTGSYKVRFGNFPTEKLARAKAESLREAGIIKDFFIVNPEDYAVARMAKLGSSRFRDEIVRTAETFVGVPYLWGGSSSDEGFDCSGLTLAVYRHNGLNLPRSSCDQFESGTPVEKDRLLKGDLVFFNTSGVKKISHVGIYIGDGKFIHAPGRGKKIGVASLKQRYFADRYAGGRSYI